ncbi:MAG: hypothetical protein M3495_14960 [Pseudomonadota bacterium]|nr:hypothetical protein [Pseudomonadota bacterium]
MNWESLELVAAESPGKMGLVIGQPVVSTPDGLIFIIRDVLAHQPQLNSPVTLDALWESAYPRYIGVPHRQAKPGAVTLVVSPSFRAQIGGLAVSPTFLLESIAEGLAFGYQEHGLANQWRKSVADALLKRAAQGYARATSRVAGSPDIIELRHVEMDLRQCRYVTEPGTTQRKELYALLKLVLTHTGPDRWPAVADLLLRESDGAFVSTVDRRAAELEQSSQPDLIFAPRDVRKSHRPIARLQLLAP